MNTKEKIALAIVGVEIVAMFGASIYYYGKSQYYKGRISLAREMNKASEEVLEAFNEHLNEMSKSFTNEEGAKLS